MSIEKARASFTAALPLLLGAGLRPFRLGHLSLPARLRLAMREAEASRGISAAWDGKPKAFRTARWPQPPSENMLELSNTYCRAHWQAQMAIWN